MKKLILITFVFFNFLSIKAQPKLYYGITAGANISSAILPDLDINTDINAILHGDAVAEGTPQLADFVTLYKAGVFFRLDGKIGSAKLNINYTKSNISEDVDATLVNIEALDLNLGYLDFDITYNLNLFKNFYFSAGYIPSILVNNEENLDINSFDQRLLTGIGFRFANGATIDFNAVASISEIIDGSYIHNIMIPITVNIPLNK